MWIRLVVLLALAASSAAETGPSLVLRPARPGKNATLRAEIEHYLDGRTDLTLAKIDGAWRATRGSLALGLTAELLEIGSGNAQLPQRLMDASFAAGFSLGSLDGWDVKAVLGFGTASNQPFSDSRGWYGLGTLAAVKEVDRGERWAIVVTYDGNRGFLPHYPLPGFQYQRFVNPGLRFVVGFPYNLVVWKPSERWELELAGVPPFGVTAQAAYLPAPDWRVFVRYRAERVRGHVAGTAARFTLHYEEQTVELGAVWEPREGFSFVVAGGYGFEREFENESDSGREFGSVPLSDEPYVRFEVSITF